MLAVTGGFSVRTPFSLWVVSLPVMASPFFVDILARDLEMIEHYLAVKKKKDVGKLTVNNCFKY